MRSWVRGIAFAVASAASLVPAACSEDEPAPASTFTPGAVQRPPLAANARGLLDRRGLVHAHSVYSHDACDGAPRDESGAIDRVCLEDFRRGLCQAKHDFVMLTDDDDSLARTDFRELTLFDPARGDELIERDGRPVASRLACPDGTKALVLVGVEGGTMMPVGLEEHVAATEEERARVYRSKEAADLERLRAAGAVTLVAHTEQWTAEQLAALPLDGFEMYNLHANTIVGGGCVVQLIAKLNSEPEQLPHPDLTLLPIVNEDPKYLGTWGSVLATGARRVTTMGTDCHRNTFKSELPDGERMDSYRRMMIWFSNHLLVRPDGAGGFDDRALKEALRGGRLYGVFDVLGSPVGFDYRAESGAGPAEMGASVPLAPGLELVVTAATVADLGPGDDRPDLVTRLLRARPGGWDVVAEAAGDLRHAPAEPGAYRAEIRMKPRHLTRFLKGFAEYGERDYVWIYANPIYVR